MLVCEQRSLYTDTIQVEYVFVYTVYNGNIAILYIRIIHIIFSAYYVLDIHYGYMVNDNVSCTL